MPPATYTLPVEAVARHVMRTIVRSFARTANVSEARAAQLLRDAIDRVAVHEVQVGRRPADDAGARQPDQTPEV